jgi:hypothetical protein
LKEKEEFSDLLRDFEEPGHLAPNGLFLGGEKYRVIEGKPGAVIRGKKGTKGITCKKTGQGELILTLYFVLFYFINFETRIFLNGNFVCMPPSIKKFQ